MYVEMRSVGTWSAGPAGDGPLAGPGLPLQGTVTHGTSGFALRCPGTEPCPVPSTGLSCGALSRPWLCGLWARPGIVMPVSAELLKIPFRGWRLPYRPRGVCLTAGPLQCCCVRRGGAGPSAWPRLRRSLSVAGADIWQLQHGPLSSHQVRPSCTAARRTRVGSA